MSLTKVQPSGLDQSLNYSANQLSANTVVAGGVDLYEFANNTTNVVINIPSQFLLMGA